MNPLENLNENGQRETLKKIDKGVYTYRGWRIERKVWTLPRSVEWYAIKGDEEDEYPTLREAREWIDELTKETEQ